MSVAADLQLNPGCKRRLFVKIDSLKPILWEVISDGASVNAQAGISSIANTVPDRYQVFGDEFANNVVDLSTSTPAGAVTEGSGKLTCSLNALENGDWGAVTATCPVAYTTIPSVLTDYDLIIMETKITQIIGTGNLVGGMCLWINRDNVYLFDLTDSPWVLSISKIVANVETFGLATVTTNNDPSTNSLYLRVIYNPATLAATFYYSYDNQITWHTLYSATLDFTPTLVGLFSKNWSPYPAVATDFDYLRIYESWSRSAPDSVTGATTDYSMACYVPSREYSTSINFQEAWQDLSAMTFDFLDIKDTDGNSYFGKKFAPARWLENKHWRVAFGTAPNQFIDADATALDMKSNYGLDANGYYYLGKEAFTFTGSAGNQLTGVVKGRHPCVGSSYGFTYKIGQAIEADVELNVANVPFTWHGRRVALYITTWDYDKNEWKAEGEEVLLWTGRISDTIKYNPNRQIWSISCVSFLSDLDKDILTDLPQTSIYGFNFRGDDLKFLILLSAWEDIGGGVYDWVSSTYTITLPGDFYQDETYMLKSLNAQLRATGITTWLNVNEKGFWAYPIGVTIEKIRIVFLPKWYNSLACHIFIALGFVDNFFESAEFEIKVVDEQINYYWRRKSVKAYHVIHRSVNSNRLYLNNVTKIWTKQQSDGANNPGFLLMPKTVNSEGDDEPTFIEYNGITSTLGTIGYATLANNYVKDPVDPGLFLRILKNEDEDETASTVRQCYHPIHNPISGAYRGPFEQLLFLLLSSGTDGYNHATYDKLSLSASCAIQSQLVNVQSFVNQDLTIRGNQLADRSNYFVHEAITFKELLTRECKLFGKVLVWKKGQLWLQDLIAPLVSDTILQLTDSSRARENEFCEIDMPLSTVVNKYSCKLNFNHTTNKFTHEITINDADSIYALGAYEMEIEHPGVTLKNSSDMQRALQNLLVGRFYRFPSQCIKISLNPTYLYRIFAGDVVKITSSFLMDPLGSGTVTASSVYAIVMSINWDYKTYVGSADLLLLSRYAKFGYPWAPAAYINIFHSSNGWDPTTKTLYLHNSYFAESGDAADGMAFLVGDKVRIISRCPADPTSPTTYGPYTIATAWDTVDHLHLDEDAMPYLSNTQEYIITFADYTDCVASQLTNGIWQASTTTEKLDTSVTPMRYG